MTTFSVSPYFDDFDENSKFLRILFRPGYAVQARELTQAQTILQNQISRVGNHLFKDGSMIIPGNIGQDIVDYVKLQTTTSIGELAASFLSLVENTIVTGKTSGLQALVLKTSVEDGVDANTIFVKYLNSGTSGETVFIDGEDLVNDAEFPLTLTVLPSSATGKGSIATLQHGIYYIKGFFVLVEKDIIILDKYSTSPSYRIGLQITESVITPEVDESLYDNAIGSPNQSAPGAHRYKISTTLVKLPLNSTDDSNFIELLRLDSNTVQLMVNKTSYSELEKTLARRTFDESGDYIVNGFIPELREHRNNDRGQWIANTSYLIGDVIKNNANKTYFAKSSGVSGATIPSFANTFETIVDGSVTWEYTEYPEYNNGIFLATGDESKYVVSISPGKAYVKGFEIEKLNTSYVELTKARDFERTNNSSVTTNIGNYVLIKNTYSVLETIGSNFPKIDLYDTKIAANGTASGTKVGEARAKWIEYHDTTRNKLFLFDIKMNAGKTFEKNVKSVYYNNTTLSLDFTADIDASVKQLSGSINVTSATAATGTGTKFVTELVVGDYISYSLISTGTIYTAKVTSITNDTTLVLSGATSTSGAVVSFGVESAIITDPQYTASIYQTQNTYIRSIRSSDDSSVDTRYYITRNFGTKTTDGSGVISIVLTGTDQFAPNDVKNYSVVNNSTGAYASPTIVVSGATLTLSGLGVSTAYTVYGTIIKTAQEKTKTLNLTVDISNNTSALATSSVIYLKPDVYKILSIKQAPAFGAITSGNLATLDITSNYKFDTGQRSTHYDRGSISLIQNAPMPTGSIQIVYEYFTHGTGDYFSVDSYKNVIPYHKIIPVLRDSLDFRPRINDAGTDFSGTNLGIVKRGFDISADYSYYLPKLSNIELNSYGEFGVGYGTSALNPTEPEITRNTMLVSKLYNYPYTLVANSDNIELSIVDNKRYTMRDIGALEKRIENVEYYTSLSLLEQETTSLKIMDSTGLDRFKNGFLVDAFDGHGVGDSFSIDYSCAVDDMNHILRPKYNIDHIDLIESGDVTQRIVNNYQVTGDIITLPYSNVPFITQEFASRVENVNPFAVFTFIGATTLKPSSDNWFENTQAPDVVINREGNYNTLKSLADKTNALDTVWGAWNTTWSGNVKTDTYNVLKVGHWGGLRVSGDINDFGYSTNLNNAISSWGGVLGLHERSATFQTTSATLAQSRTGVKTNLVAKIDTQTIDDKVISTSIIPYMRARNISFLSRGLKPNSTFHAFFDSISIDSYITPASSLVFESITGFSSTFDYTTNAAGDAANDARNYGTSADTALVNGDVITGLSSGTTAVLLLQENATSTKTLKIVNIRGAGFSIGEVITGSLSSARGKVLSITNKSIGSTLTSNFNGDACGLLSIPNNSALKFRTGNHEFKLTTSATNGVDSTSQSRADFSATGVLNVNQKTILATRNAEFAQEIVADTRTITETTTRVLSDTGWYDPLAQSFLVRQAGGAFLTAIDVYFASKDSNIPVQLELREMVNGTPSAKVLPNSRVLLLPDAVNISSNVVTLDDGKSYKAPDVATKFTFNSPIYVNDNTEYCLVLLSDSNNYNVWISQLGDKVVGQDRLISDQPYAGVLFKSQNASTWTENQYQDLTFKIYRAEFQNVTGTVKLKNTPIQPSQMGPNSFQTIAGNALVRVRQPNHGMVDNNRVTISGFASGSYNGIPHTDLNATFVVSNCDLDSYTITIPTSGTFPSASSVTTGFFGSNTVYATRNCRYELLQPSIQYLNFPQTSADFKYKGTQVTTSTHNVDSNFSQLVPNMDNSVFAEKYILSPINQTQLLSGNNSFEMTATLQTSNTALSPVIDLHRVAMIGVSNYINTPSATLNTAVDKRSITPGDATFSFDSATSRIAPVSNNAAVIAFIKSLQIGKYLTISSATTGANNGTYLITAVDYDGGTYVTLSTTFTTENSAAGTKLEISDYFVSEISGVGSSSMAKYLTKTVGFANASTHCTVMFAYNAPIATTIDVYYKAIPNNNSSINSEYLPFVKMNPDSALVKRNDGMFMDAKYSLSGIAPFSNLIIKIVMNSTNLAFVPSIKDFRVIACA